jgi:hypothetical protein
MESNGTSNASLRNMPPVYINETALARRTTSLETAGEPATTMPASTSLQTVGRFEIRESCR